MVNASKIIALRREKKMTQAKLADKVGIGTSHLSHIENGKSGVSLETLQAIAQALEVAVEDLLIETERTVPSNIIFEHGEGKEKIRCILPATPEGYVFLKERLASVIDQDEAFKVLCDLWANANEEMKRRILLAAQEITGQK